MTAIVSTFLDIDLGKGKYLFFLITMSDFESKLTEELDKQWPIFGEALGVNGTAIRSFSKKTNQTYDEVFQKPWPLGIAARMLKEQDPYMLITDTPFEEFDPNNHNWSIIWFSDFFKKSDLIYRVFGILAKKVADGEDIFHWTSSLSKKAGLAQHVEVKPGIFGVSLNMTPALEKILGIDV